MWYTTTLRAVGQSVGQDGAASAQRATASLLGFRTSRRKSREPGIIRPRITCVSSVPPLRLRGGASVERGVARLFHGIVQARHCKTL